MENVISEWQECRNTIARFDGYLLRIRLLGFSVFTLLFTTITSVSGVKSGIHEFSPHTIIIAILILSLFEVAVYILDRYYERMLLVSVLRASRLEAIQLEGFQIGLTTEIEFQKAQLKRNSLSAKLAKASSMVNFVYVLIFLALASQCYISMVKFRVSYFYYIICTVFFILIILMSVVAHLLLREPNQLIKKRAGIITSPIVICNSEIKMIVAQMAASIYEWYKKFQHKPLNIVAILAGARSFTEDLMSSLRVFDKDIKINLHLVRLSNTIDNTLYKECRWIYGKVEERLIVGNPTLIVDVLLDSGKTLKKVYNTVAMAKPDGIRTVVLLKKHNDVVFEPDIVGFNLGLNKRRPKKNGIKEYRLFGYGLDLDGMYREIEHIGWIEVPD